jgi:hypothetical protein
MPDHPLLAEHRHALLVMPAAPEALPELQRLGLEVATWAAPDTDPAYGETLVGAVASALAAGGATLLVTPDPADHDPRRRALALAGIEAARRTGGVDCAWRHARPASETTAPDWTVLATDELADALPARVRGIHADRARMPACEEPHAGATRVSVIVRSMDRPSLVEALDSIALQTHRATEVVIVNARGPGHGPLPEQCGGLPVVGAAPAPARPLPRALAANLGVGAAGGPLLLFLDDDDMLLPDHLSRLVGTLEVNPAAPAAYTGVSYGRLDGSRWRQQHCFDAGFDPTRLLFENYLPIHGVMFRKARFGADARFDESFDLFEDWDFWLQLAQQGDFIHVPGVSARYLMSDSGQSEVFFETPAAEAARARLFEKWRQRSRPAQYAAVLRRLQALYREAAQAQAELQLLRDGQAQLQSVLAARESEIADAAQMLRGMQDIAAARERESADATRHAAGLAGIVVEREREIAAAATHVAGLQEILAAREVEIAAAATHVAGLEHILAQRRRELDDALAEIGALRGIVDARDREIAAQARELAELAAASLQKGAQVDALQAELSRLLAEGPLQALKRTLRR